MPDIGGDRKLSVDRESIPEAVQIARAWMGPIRLVQRMERRAAGLPPLKLMTDDE